MTTIKFCKEWSVSLNPKRTLSTNSFILSSSLFLLGILAIWGSTLSDQSTNEFPWNHVFLINQESLFLFCFVLLVFGLFFSMDREMWRVLDHERGFGVAERVFVPPVRSNNLLCPREDSEKRNLVYGCQNCDYEVSFFSSPEPWMRFLVLSRLSSNFSRLGNIFSESVGSAFLPSRWQELADSNIVYYKQLRRKGDQRAPVLNPEPVLPVTKNVRCQKCKHGEATFFQVLLAFSRLYHYYYYTFARIYRGLVTLERNFLGKAKLPNAPSSFSEITKVPWVDDVLPICGRQYVF